MLQEAARTVQGGRPDPALPRSAASLPRTGEPVPRSPTLSPPGALHSPPRIHAPDSGRCVKNSSWNHPRKHAAIPQRPEAAPFTRTPRCVAGAGGPELLEEQLRLSQRRRPPEDGAARSQNHPPPPHPWGAGLGRPFHHLRSESVRGEGRVARAVRSGGGSRIRTHGPFGLRLSRAPP